MRTADYFNVLVYIGFGLFVLWAATTNPAD